MNENRRIDNPWIRIVQCVGALKMKTCVESLQKHTMGLIFNIQNSQLLNWPLPTDEIFQVHEKNRTVAKIPAVDRRQVASFLYAQPLCIENWIRNKSFKKLFLCWFRDQKITNLKFWWIKDIYFLSVWRMEISQTSVRGFYCGTPGGLKPQPTENTCAAWM